MSDGYTRWGGVSALDNLRAYVAADEDDRDMYDVDFLALGVRELLAERDALTRERDGLRLALVATSEQSDTLARDLDICREDRSRLAAARAWVRQHGQHPPECAAAKGERCDCGLDSIRGYHADTDHA